MNEQPRPTNWQLVKQAVEQFDREVSYGEIKKHIWSQYPDVNGSSLTCEIVTCSVNHPSRVHYSVNKKIRKSDGLHDFFYYTKRGHVTPYDPETNPLSPP